MYQLTRDIQGPWFPATKIIDEEIKEVVTIGKNNQTISWEGGNNFGSNGFVTNNVQQNTWNDQLLRSLRGKDGKIKKVAWRPGGGRHVDEGPQSYEPFTHVVRTLHIDDAVQVVVSNRIKPKNLVTFSSLESSMLHKGHPCQNMKILWFSAKFSNECEEKQNWYGNVEFAIPCSLLLEMFQYSFLVEMLTTPTHTVSRVLLTNEDYSAVLPFYNKDQTGGGWKVTPEGQFALRKCSRYRFRGYNTFDHILEFMLEVSPQDEEKILSNCKISFKNHEDAKDTSQPHVCNRYQRLHQPCPFPLTSVETAVMFRQTIVQDTNVHWRKTVRPKLTTHAKKCLSDVN